MRILSNLILLFISSSGLQAQVAVNVKPVFFIKDSQPLTLVGTVEPYKTITIQSKSGGRIASILVEENQHVKTGEELVNLENSTTKLQMELSKLQVDLAENTLKEAIEFFKDNKKKLDNENKLFKEGTSTRQRIDAIRLQLTRSQIAVESGKIRVMVANKELELRNKTYQDTIINSPINGIITRRFHEPGEIVGTGTILLEVINIDSVRIICGISEEEVGGIRMGLPLTFKVPAFPGKTFKGVLEKLAWDADVQTRRFDLVVLAKNPKRVLRGGMTAQLQISSEKDSQPAVPPSALVNESGNSYVFVIKGEKLVRRDVHVLGSAQGLLKVSGKLNAGELIVVSSQRKLKPGQKIKISNP